MYCRDCTEGIGVSGMTGHCTVEVPEVNMPRLVTVQKPQVETGSGGAVILAKQYN